MYLDLKVLIKPIMFTNVVKTFLFNDKRTPVKTVFAAATQFIKIQSKTFTGLLSISQYCFQHLLWC